MRWRLSPLLSHDLSPLAVRTVAVVVLIPLILLVGLLAVIVLMTMILSRRAAQMTDRRRSTTGARSRLRLEPSSAESSLGMVSGPAA